MWERAIGVPGNAGRSDVEDLTDADLSTLAAGMTPEEMLWRLGQPAARAGATFNYWMTAGESRRLTFTPDESLSDLAVAAS